MSLETPASNCTGRGLQSMMLQTEYFGIPSTNFKRFFNSKRRSSLIDLCDETNWVTFPLAPKGNKEHLSCSCRAAYIREDCNRVNGAADANRLQEQWQNGLELHWPKSSIQ